MVDIGRKLYERNGRKTIVDNDGILWLKEKYIEEGLDYKNLQEITRKYNSNHRKLTYELLGEPKTQCYIIFIDEKLPVKVIMNCRMTSAYKVRTRLGFKQYDVILTKEKSVLTKILSSFEGENMQTRYNILGYRIDLYFHDYKLAIETDEN